jgi:hypothetical protein
MSQKAIDGKTDAIPTKYSERSPRLLGRLLAKTKPKFTRALAVFFD